MGPTYCETPLGFFTFPAEPVNTFSNLVIIGFGIAAFWILGKRTPKSWDLYLLAVLIVLNGVGSFLWHGLRTPWALTLDVTPGLLFLLTLIYLWSRRLFGWRLGALVLIAFFAIAQFGGVVSELLTTHFFFMGPLIAIAVVGTFLVYHTYQKYGGVVVRVGVIIALALLALVCRTVDQQMCVLFPFGIHFLWHIFLSTASFLSLIFLIRLDDLSVSPALESASGVLPQNVTAPDHSKR